MVNIKYDRENFLNYKFVLKNILLRLGEVDLVKQCFNEHIFVNYNNSTKMNTIWKDIEKFLDNKCLKGKY